MLTLTVLVDNNTLIDRYYQGEPGVAYHVACDGETVLFDTGYSEVLLQNAAKMQIDLRQLTAVVLSHGHNDHTWGLWELVKLYSEAKAAGQPVAQPALIGHPAVLADRQVDGLPIGAGLAVNQLGLTFRLAFSPEPLWLSERLVFLGAIERRQPFEGKQAVGTICCGTDWQPDYVEDDSALVYKGENGLVIITGCSHAGICNIVDQAKRVCQEERIQAIIGGLHLLQAEPAVLNATAEHLAACRIDAVYACHCTDLAAKLALAQALPLREVGVGLQLSYR